MNFQQSPKHRSLLEESYMNYKRTVSIRRSVLHHKQKIELKAMVRLPLSNLSYYYYIHFECYMCKHLPQIKKPMHFCIGRCDMLSYLQHNHYTTLTLKAKVSAHNSLAVLLANIVPIDSLCRFFPSTPNHVMPANTVGNVLVFNCVQPFFQHLQFFFC